MFIKSWIISIFHSFIKYTNVSLCFSSLMHAIIMNARKQKKKKMECSLSLWHMHDCMPIIFRDFFFFVICYRTDNCLQTIARQIEITEEMKMKMRMMTCFERHWAGFFFSFSLSFDRRLTCTSCRRIKHLSIENTIVNSND